MFKLPSSDQFLVNVTAKTAFRGYENHQFFRVELGAGLAAAKIKSFVYPQLAIDTPQIIKEVAATDNLVFDLGNPGAGNTFKGAGQLNHYGGGVTSSGNFG